MDNIYRPKGRSAWGTWAGQPWEMEGAILSGHWVLLHLSEEFSAPGTTWFANGEARVHGCLQGSAERAAGKLIRGGSGKSSPKLPVALWAGPDFSWFHLHQPSLPIKDN